MGAPITGRYGDWLCSDSRKELPAFGNIAEALETSREMVVAYILERIAEGHYRPASWERGVLEQMGLVEF